MTEKYRKPDQHYIDEYDRTTIRMLKKLEAEATTPLIIPADSFVTKDHYNPMTEFYEMGVWRAQSKSESIRKQMTEDENQDWLVKTTPIPHNIKCNTCRITMNVVTHFFKESNNQMLFIFECPNEHKPRKAILPNGTEYFFPKRRCLDCSGEESSSIVKENKIITWTVTCLSCGKETIDTYPLEDDINLPIKAEDRDKYCDGFKNMKTFRQSIIEFGELAKTIMEAHNEREEKKNLGFENIQKPTIPQLEVLLQKVLEENGFIKLQFEKPDLGRQVVIAFSLQDPTTRTEKESIKVITKAIKKSLFTTNWRLMAEGISFRLGYLTGRLKSYEQDEDLMKIAKEINVSQKK
jgi:hypothetical protein